MTRRMTLVGLALIVAIFAVGVVYVSQNLHGGPVPSATAQANFYHCPMHPAMVSDRPADCPICGMRMVPMEESEKKL